MLVTVPQSTRVVLMSRICQQEAIKFFNCIGEHSWLERKNKSSVNVAKIDSNNKSVQEIVKKEKGNHTTFAIIPQTVKVPITVYHKYYIKIQKALDIGFSTVHYWQTV
jgi:hypothetical protein